MHCAGIVKARNTDEFFAVNVGGTSNLVEAARTRGKSLKRFVHVSSLEACGPSADGAPVPADQENPVTGYGRSKLAAEKVVLSAKDEMPVVILRPAAIYGPRDVRDPRRSSSPSSAASSRSSTAGASKGVWIYATDCAEACLRAIDADVPSGARLLRRRRLRRHRRAAHVRRLRAGPRRKGRPRAAPPAHLHDGGARRRSSSAGSPTAP